MTVTPIVMPRLGLTMEEGTVVRWLKREGDQVHKGEDLLEVEIDKGAVVAEAPASGVLRAVRATPGECVPVGRTIGYIADSADELLSDGVIAPPSTGAAQPAALTPLTVTPVTASTTASEIRAAPAARRRAAELGIDLARVTPTGPGGRITSEDVEHAAQLGPGQPTPVPAAGPSTRILSRTRLAVVDLMTQSQASIPQFAVRATVNASAVESARTRAQHLSPLDFIIRACASALNAHPEANATFERVSPDTAQLVIHDHVNIGVAVATDAGLVVPVIADADRLTLAEVAAARRAAVERARSGRLSPADLATAVLTISNLGPFGTEEFTAMVIPPQAAILAVGAILEGPIVRNGRVEVAPLLRLSLSVDHRVLDGAAAGQLLRTTVRHLEEAE